MANLPSDDFRSWLYTLREGRSGAIKLRDFLKNHSDWQGQSIDSLRDYLDKTGLTPFMFQVFIETITDYVDYKDAQDGL